MAEIINLRRARKRLDREARATDAAAARAKHGQTPGERAAAAAQQEAVRRSLDGAKLTQLPRDGEAGE